jgi:hypothetical protein
MAILLHGTTRQRAEKIAANGPDETLLGEDGFSTYLASGPFFFGLPEDYACGKAALFDNEGGGAIIEMDVPDPIIQLAVDESFPLEQGLIQFNKGKGLDELLAAWPGLSKTIRLVDCP